MDHDGDINILDSIIITGPTITEDDIKQCEQQMVWHPDIIAINNHFNQNHIESPRELTFHNYAHIDNLAKSLDEELQHPEIPVTIYPDQWGMSSISVYFSYIIQMSDANLSSPSVTRARCRYASYLISLPVIE